MQLAPSAVSATLQRWTNDKAAVRIHRACDFFVKADVIERNAGTPFITASDDIACPRRAAQIAASRSAGIAAPAALNTRNCAPAATHDPRSNPTFASRAH